MVWSRFYLDVSLSWHRKETLGLGERSFLSMWMNEGRIGEAQLAGPFGGNSVNWVFCFVQIGGNKCGLFIREDASRSSLLSYLSLLLRIVVHKDLLLTSQSVAKDGCSKKDCFLVSDGNFQLRHFYFLKPKTSA